MIYACLARAKAAVTLISLCLLFAGCAEPGPSNVKEIWHEQMRITAVEPITVVPGTVLVGRGEGFVGELLGTTRLTFSGEFTPASGAPTQISSSFLARVVSQERLEVDLEPSLYQQVCAGQHGEFVGTIALEVASVATGRIYRTGTVPAGLKCRSEIQPKLIGLDGGEAWLNSTISVTADDLLLDTNEGRSVMAVSGCFRPRGVGEPCSANGVPIAETRLPIAVPEGSRAWRQDGSFILSTALVGLSPGTIEAEVRIINEHSYGGEVESDPMAWEMKINPSILDGVDPEGSSFGGYVDFFGRGLVGGEPDELTEIHLTGELEPDTGDAPRPLDVILIPTFDSGQRVRYILSEDDALGQIADLRRESGLVTGTFTPTLVKGQETIEGDPVTGAFRINLIKQVVYVNFMQGYVDALDMFGMRAADGHIRQRILEKARWIYRGVNVEFRDTPPSDYELYAQVDITGQDPNGLGLMGYDNTPGKDVGNDRLYDRIGGVNAQTQQDGYAGYGGVFVESFFAFSLQPPVDIDEHPAADPLFDAIFDPVRPDTGQPVRPEELGQLPAAGSGVCPAAPDDRPAQIACAIYVLGNILGGTMAHELGHSLGLADPGGDNFHNTGEEPNRLMDAGGKRPFDERAQLRDGGPEVFCTESFEYLQEILPTPDQQDPVPYRPTCF
jgi:hypothetical protein